MSKARRLREEAEAAERERKAAEAFEKERLPKLDALVKEYEYQHKRWDGNCGPPDARQAMFNAMNELQEGEGWYFLMEFYSRRRRKEGRAMKKLSTERKEELLKRARDEGSGTVCLPGDELEAILEELRELEFRMRGLEK